MLARCESFQSESLKHSRDMIIKYSHMHRTDKYSHHSTIIWPVWLNGSVFVYELSGCRFKSHCCHLKELLKLVDLQSLVKNIGKIAQVKKNL